MFSGEEHGGEGGGEVAITPPPNFFSFLTETKGLCCSISKAN